MNVALFPYKAIFVDLDGTLLNSKKIISKRNLDCLNSFIESGIHVVIATGRAFYSVQQTCVGLNLIAPVIALNGSDIRQSIAGAPLAISYLDNKLRDYMYDFCRELVQLKAAGSRSKYAIQNIIVDTGKGFYCLSSFKMDMDELLSHYGESPKELDLNNPPQESIVSFLLLLTPESNRDAFLASLSNKVKFCIFNGFPWIEVGSPNVNKGTAMKYVCEHLTITPQEVVAFGDGANDIEMLAEAGLGVAMANGDIHAIRAAKEIAPLHDEDGVAVFLERIIKNNEISDSVKNSPRFQR